jgi:uncharacterized protein (DUF427 family)
MSDDVRPEVESVWDYPRPPAVRTVHERIEVWFAGERIAACDEAVQVLETSHPPTYYLPRSAFADGVLVPVRGTTFCEFKGSASYFDVVAGDRRAERAAWYYPEARGRYAPLLGHVAVMPGLMDRCTVDGEEVVPQEGGFYGGWITSRVSGPFKGAPGTLGW